MEPSNITNNRVDISACLESVNMYNADYHRERIGDLDDYQKTEYVSVVEHVWAKVNKTSTSLMAHGLLALMGIAALLIVANIVHNISEYQASQPAANVRPPEEVHYGSPVKILDSEASLGPYMLPPPVVPLQPNWEAANSSIYFTLLCICGLSYWAAMPLMRQSEEINPGIPISPANTADLPAFDSLVRASSEPLQIQRGVLLRASTPLLKPEQLVRPAAFSGERQPEQLVRSVAGRKE